jgi:hypothetical protein
MSATQYRRLLSFLVALELFFQGQQFGEGRIRIRLLVAALLARAPDPRRPVFVAPVAVAITPRRAAGTLGTLGPILGAVALVGTLFLAIRRLGAPLARLAGLLLAVVTAMAPAAAMLPIVSPGLRRW